MGGIALSEPNAVEPVRQRSASLKRQEAVVALGRRAIAPPDLPVLMQDAVVLIAEMLDVEHSAVAELSPDGVWLELWLELWNSETGKSERLVHKSRRTGTDSLADYTLQVAHTVEMIDLACEKRFQDTFLRGHGISSAVAVPLQRQDCSFGALIAASSRCRRFDPEDVLFAETIAHLITTTAARFRAEESLAEERRRSAGVLGAVDAIVLILDGEGKIQDINRACAEVTGFSRAEIEGRPIWNVFPIPEEADMFQLIFEKLQKSNSPVEYESSLLTKHSKRRRIAWSYAATTKPNGAIESILATGIDITEQRNSSNRLSPDMIPSERRNRPRRSYPYHQRIAPIIDGKLPDSEDFTTIECNDIGAGGFSFIADSPPRSESLVVALGVPPMLTYLIGQIAHATRVDHDGKRKYLIGCNYIGRAAY